MGLNLILVITGLIICFLSIYIQKLCSAILGFIWGAFCAFVAIIMFVGWWDFDKEHSFLVLVIAIICAALCAIYEEICVILNFFLSAFFLAMFFLLMAGFEEGMWLILIAIVIAVVVCAIVAKIYEYAFIIMTAFSGAFIASVGGCGLKHDEDAATILLELMFGDEVTVFILAGTLILGVMGFLYQRRALVGTGKSATDTLIMDAPVAEKCVEYGRFVKNYCGEIAELPIFGHSSQYPLVREMKEYWGLLLAPWVVTAFWGMCGGYLIVTLFPWIYGDPYGRLTIWRYVPSIISACLGGWELATFVVTVKTRSKEFGLLWMVPSIAVALTAFFADISGGLGLFPAFWATLSSFVPFLSWWVILQLEKVSATFARKDAKAFVLSGICEIIVAKIAGKILFFFKTLLIPFSPGISMFSGVASFFFLIIRIVVMYFVVQRIVARERIRKRK